MDASIKDESLFNEWFGHDIKVKHEYSGLTMYLNSKTLPNRLTQEYLSKTVGKCKLPPEMLLIFFSEYSFVPKIGLSTTPGLNFWYDIMLTSSIMDYKYEFLLNRDPEHDRSKFDLRRTFKKFFDISKNFTNTTLERIILDICRRACEYLIEESDLKSFVLQDIPLLLPIYGAEFYGRCMFLAGGYVKLHASEVPPQWVFDWKQEPSAALTVKDRLKNNSCSQVEKQVKPDSVQLFKRGLCRNFCLNFSCNRTSSPTNLTELKFVESCNFEVLVFDKDTDCELKYKIHDWILYNRWEWFKNLIDSGMEETRSRSVRIEMPNFVFKMLMTYIYLTGEICGVYNTLLVPHDFERGERIRCHHFIRENAVYYKIFNIAPNSAGTGETFVSKQGWENFDNFWVDQNILIESDMPVLPKNPNLELLADSTLSYWFTGGVAFCHK